MKYHFTRKLPNLICRMCGKTFDKEWSNGGIGSVCMECAEEKDNLDLIELGIIRNIEQYESNNYSDGYGYRFEALIDGEWYKCSQPCGNWSMVGENKHGIFLVPVGWWELNDLYNRHNK